MGQEEKLRQAWGQIGSAVQRHYPPLSPGRKSSAHDGGATMAWWDDQYASFHKTRAENLISE